ncbi:hypothetical protein BDV27DRAFT_139901 [Aspergillus caelatus]|uniref:Uncharacterized protein n=1 Tax=Aspergillus caelatus TaxID=61420 RepID=A0A5N6ZHJ4_9EURO|nr:uncharacterized protein BDV27DRAFT_139901 [Aspergillus caelatus]KAE8357122.1 hypothetical protein BDV27DRAFT_139901 [Aspergillus caelatus]
MATAGWVYLELRWVCVNCVKHRYIDTVHAPEGPTYLQPILVAVHASQMSSCTVTVTMVDISIPLHVWSTCRPHPEDVKPTLKLSASGLVVNSRGKSITPSLVCRLMNQACRDLICTLTHPSLSNHFYPIIAPSGVVYEVSSRQDVTSINNMRHDLTPFPMNQGQCRTLSV